MKRIISMMLALATIIAIAAPVAAASTSSSTSYKDVVAKINENYYLDFQGNAFVHPEETRPGDYILIPLERAGFEDSSGSLIDWDGSQDMGPSKNQLRSNRIDVSYETISGPEVIRDIKIVEFTPTRRIRCQSAIRIRFKKEFLSTKELKYQFKIYLTMDKKLASEKLQFDGMFSNQTVEVYTGRDYVYLGDSDVALCTGPVENIRVDLGCGISHYTEMIKDEKYYAIAENMDDLEEEKDAIFSTYYDDIVAAYKLKTVNLRTDGNVIEFTDFAYNEKYYVYNIRGELIGMSNQRLPYSEKYYLTAKEIEIDAEHVTYTDPEEKIQSEAFKEFKGNLEK